MSDQPETLAAILAEIREAAKSTDLFNGEEVGEPLIRGTKVEEWADRIKAAAEREREAYCELCREKDAAYDRLLFERDKAIKERDHSNAAALCEALEEQLRYWNSHVRTRDEEEMRKRTEAALAAPARNADRFKTMEAARSAFRKFCRENYNSAYAASGLDGCDDCELCETKNMSGEDVCPFAWLFAPAEGGDHA